MSARKKNLFFAFFTLIIFFLGLEFVTRVYWSVKESNFLFMLYKGNYQTALKETVESFPRMDCGNYRKYNPRKKYKRHMGGNFVTINSKGFRGEEFDNKSKATRIGCTRGVIGIWLWFI